MPVNGLGPFVISLLACVVVPQPADRTGRIHDFAQVLTPSMAQALEQLAQGVERETTAQMAVVTVPSLDGLSVDEYAHRLFNDWGIGQRDANNGVLLLVAPNERRMRIEVGYGLEPLLTDGLCGEIRDQSILPPFRQGHLAQGIDAGAREIARILREHPQAARGAAGSAPLWVRTPRRDALGLVWIAGGAALLLVPIIWFVTYRRWYSPTFFFMATAALTALVATAGWAVWNLPSAQRPWIWLSGSATAVAGTLVTHWRRFRRYGPRNCSRCGTRLVLLSETEDDAKLTEKQQLEEKLGSVNYDVWYCPACLAEDTESYVSFFSSFSTCPKCRARAFKEGRQNTVIPATYVSAGRAQVEGRCVHCNFKRVRSVVLAKLVRSSSTSSGGWGGGGGGGGGGGSFGGGSSGGGGASGGW